MIIGNGLIASTFKNEYEHSKNVLIFASGVSNSLSSLEDDFAREKRLLFNLSNSYCFDNFLVVYFSTCSISTTNSSEISPYIKHKIEMEALISQLQNYLIIRLPQTAGFTNNPYTLLNYLFNHINSSTRFEAWPLSTRNIIDLEDVLKITKFIIANKLFLNSIIDIANTQNCNVLEIIKCFECITQKKATYYETNKSSKILINTENINRYLDYLNIHFDDDYLFDVLHKYYANR